MFYIYTYIYIYIYIYVCVCVCYIMYIQGMQKNVYAFQEILSMYLLFEVELNYGNKQF